MDSQLEERVYVITILHRGRFRACRVHPYVRGWLYILYTILYLVLRLAKKKLRMLFPPPPPFFFLFYTPRGMVCWFEPIRPFTRDLGRREVQVAIVPSSSDGPMPSKCRLKLVRSSDHKCEALFLYIYIYIWDHFYEKKEKEKKKRRFRVGKREDKIKKWKVVPKKKLKGHFMSSCCVRVCVCEFRKGSNWEVNDK